jgi:hypothetical protein
LAPQKGALLPESRLRLLAAIDDELAALGGNDFSSGVIVD